jgi:hypothetical protein
MQPIGQWIGVLDWSYCASLNGWIRPKLGMLFAVDSGRLGFVKSVSLSCHCGCAALTHIASCPMVSATIPFLSRAITDTGR